MVKLSCTEETMDENFLFQRITVFSCHLSSIDHLPFFCIGLALLNPPLCDSQIFVNLEIRRHYINRAFFS